MQLHLNGTVFQIDENDVLIYDDRGFIQLKVNNFLNNKRFDMIIPDYPERFQVNIDNGFRVWRNKRYYQSNVDIITQKSVKDDKDDINITQRKPGNKVSHNKVSHNKVSHNKVSHNKGLTPRLINDIKLNQYTNFDTNKREGYCLFMSLTKDFIIGYRVFIQSFFKYNNWFDGDIVIMPFDLSKEDIDYIKSFYDKIKLVKPIYENYENMNISKIRYDKFIYNYYKLDIFTFTEYEKIVSVDTDMLVQGDLSDLFYNNYGFGAVPIFTKNWNRIEEFNGGLIVLDSGCNNSENYNKVLNELKFPYEHAEQDILNKVFGDVYFTVDKTYNSEKRMLKSLDDKDVNFVTNAKIIHFVGSKPWDKNKSGDELGYDKLENLWKEYSKKKVVIIGNSPEVLNHKNKNIINSSDIVIRINDFQIEGFEDYVGNKTTHVICTFATTFNEEYKKINNSDIYMFTAEKYGDYDFLKKRVKEVDINKVNILEKYYLNELNSNIGLSIPKRCSSGLIAVEFALRNFENCDIKIYGIETEYKEKFDKTHYFNKDISIDKWKGSVDKYHDFKREKEYLQELIRKNKISKL